TFTLLAAFLALLALCPNRAHGASDFQNGSFENNGGEGSTTAAGWAFTAPDGGAAVGGGEGRTDGSFAAIFNFGDNAATGVLSQSFATVAGQTYKVRFDFG